VSSVSSWKIRTVDPSDLPTTEIAVRVAIIGTGHVGLVTAACLAHWGHEVVASDSDRKKIEGLQAGRMPFHEPDLPQLVRAGVHAGGLRFTGDASDAILGAQVVFVCVGTPPLPDGAPNLAHVEAVGRTVAACATEDVVLAEKSTVPANTGARLTAAIRHEQQRLGTTARIEVASNPEFLREGQAVPDTLRPDRLVVGVQSRRAAAVLREVYAPVIDELDVPFLVTDLVTAELIKHASNGFLAMRLSFINAVAQICDRVGADVKQVAAGMGLDRRIGPSFLDAGLGYGGSCFPKDIDAFVHLARSVGYEFRLLEAVREVNSQMRQRVLDLLRTELWHLEGKSVAVLGASFKPGTDDLRESPGMWLAERLLDEGVDVRIYDPVALPKVRVQLPKATCTSDLSAAVAGAHAAVVATEWDEIASLDPQLLAQTMAYPIVIDGRNVLDSGETVRAGLRYHGVGRPSRLPGVPVPTSGLASVPA
jgi:UDPglucose 6-dehydrogenase